MADKNEPTDEASGVNYEVGYRKPPVRTRFKPGQSGNPRGRPKGTKNLKTDLMEELGEKIVIREGDRSQKVSKQRAVVKSLVARTLKGDARSATLLTSMMMRLLETGEGAPVGEEPLREDEHEILQAFENRVRRVSGHRTDPEIDRDDALENES